MLFLNYYFNKFFKNLKKGNIVYGKIIKITKKLVILDINYKKEVYINIREFKNKGNLYIKTGDFVELIIIKVENNFKNIICSRSKFKKTIIFKYIKIILKKKKFIKGYFVKKLKTGFIVYIKNIKCFLPYSFADKKLILNHFKYKKKLINFRIVRFYLKKKSVILSRKLYIYWFKVIKKNNIFNLIKEGNYYKGIIKNFNNLGVFIDFGFFLGFVKKNFFIFKPYKYFNEVISINQSLILKILKKNYLKKSIFLNIKNNFAYNLKDYKIGSKLYLKLYKIDYKYFYFLSIKKIFIKIKKKFFINIKLNNYIEFIITNKKNNKLKVKPLLAQRIEQWPSKS